VAVEGAVDVLEAVLFCGVPRLLAVAVLVLAAVRVGPFASIRASSLAEVSEDESPGPLELLELRSLCEFLEPAVPCSGVRDSGANVASASEGSDMGNGSTGHEYFPSSHQCRAVLISASVSPFAFKNVHFCSQSLSRTAGCTRNVAAI